MIRITTRGRHALRAMVDLALHSADEPVARQDIAERQGISADYVAQLSRQLQDAESVEGLRGRVQVLLSGLREHSLGDTC